MLKPAYLKKNLEKGDGINSHVATGESYKYTNKSLSMKSWDEKTAQDIRVAGRHQQLQK